MLIEILKGVEENIALLLYVSYVLMCTRILIRYLNFVCKSDGCSI